ncbi:MAG: polysaccharide biosynthesis/export family protein [Planctomycetota bacterium]
MIGSSVRLCLFAIAVVLGGCGAARYFLDEDQLRAFEAAGPVVPELDREAMLAQIPAPGPYRLDSGDIVELRGPRALFGTESAAVALAPFEVHQARVDAGGTIEVPLIGAVEARGRTVLELEAAVQSAAHPQFLVAKPAIVARVVEFDTQAVNVLGAVEVPGIHQLRRDQMTLYGALAAAGGILKSSNLVVGARAIRVRQIDGAEGKDLVLPVKGLNVPFTDVALRRGATIEVERYEPDTFTVIGLVMKPGAYEYPPEVSYNLMQALAIAGGVDIIADPPYATVFRRDRDGRIVPATFEIAGGGLVQSSGLRIKPGDVIVIEHTAATWSRSLLAQVLRIQFGLFVDPTGD